ncbi:MAG: S41 family peptidase [Thiohalospira sp.]
MRKRIIIILILGSLLINFNCRKQNDYSKYNRQVTNLAVFARLYGYIRFFYPSDEASKIDWNKFAIYGSELVYNCSDNKELIDSLKKLFSPIAPSNNFILSDKKKSVKVLKNKIEDENLMFWQHLGLEIKDTSNRYKKNAYISQRVGTNTPSGKIFEHIPNKGASIKKEIIPGVYCNIPITLTKSYKLNRKDSAEKFKMLQQQLSLIDDSVSVDNKFVRVADIIITWNYVQHFYPYFEVVKVDWEKILFETLASALQDKDRDEFLTTLQKMMAYLNDGHAITKDLLARYGRLPIKIDLVENQVIVTYSKDTSKFLVGDILLEINDKNIFELLLEIGNKISGSKHWKKTYALEQICIGDIADDVEIKFLRNGDTLVCNSIMGHDKQLEIVRPKFKNLKNDIIYVNLNRSSMEDIYNQFDKLLKAKGIIFDLRIYPINNHQILCHLINDKKLSQEWMQIPQIIYPDHEFSGFKKRGWVLEPKFPQLEGEIVFLISSRAISYTESVLGFVEGYKLGEIIGQPTAGTNGNIVPFYLPGGFEVWFTGMKVIKHDGSQHHTIGIEPTVYVEKTIAGVKSGKDEYLEKAIEVINNKIN